MTQIVITDVDSGREFGALIGDTLAIQLTENPTTGFCWKVSAIPFMLALQGDTFQIGSASAVGGSGIHTFRFLVQSSGRGTLRFAQSREWETGAPRADFSVQIHVS